MEKSEKQNKGFLELLSLKSASGKPISVNSLTKDERDVLKALIHSEGALNVWEIYKHIASLCTWATFVSQFKGETERKIAEEIRALRKEHPEIPHYESVKTTIKRLVKMKIVSKRKLSKSNAKNVFYLDEGTKEFLKKFFEKK